MENVVPKEIVARIHENDFDSNLSGVIHGWARKSEAFSMFLISNRSKISKKLRGAREIQDQRDVGLELYAAYSLLSVGASVLYEPQGKGPDFLVSSDGFEMYVETRRVRERVATNNWSEVCKQLEREVKPFLRNHSIHLAIIASDHDFRWQGTSRPSLKIFQEQYDEVRKFIIDQVSLNDDQNLWISVKPLPEGFAKLSISSHSTPGFTYNYPVSQGDEANKLLRIVCEKSRQVFYGKTNLIFLNLNSLNEDYDDFEGALGRFERGMASNPDRFAQNMGYESSNHANDCIRACSAFLVHDACDPYQNRPQGSSSISGCRTFLVHDSGKSKVYKNLFAMHPLPDGLLELVLRSTRIPFRP